MEGTDAAMMRGIEQHELLQKVLGRARVGLLTNPTGLDSRFTPSVDILAAMCDLRCLFGPEHGVYGEIQAGEHVGDRTDPRTGLPVWSLYGEHKAPSAAMLADIDILVYDIQDVGLRWYTYPWTLAAVMEACAAAGVALVVLDRPNPLGGLRVEGIIREEGCSSFIGKYPVPARYGLTIGELARWLAREHIKGADLTIVPMAGWKAGQEWDATGLPWVPPSPNLPTLQSVRAYAATAFLEGTTLSEGRGTTLPFEIFGAPWLPAERIVKELRLLDLPGTAWRSLWFTPVFSKWAGQSCRGIQLHVTDPSAWRPWITGLQLHAVLLELAGPDYQALPPWKEGGKPPLALLHGSTDMLATVDLQSVLARAHDEALGWIGAVEPYLLYERTMQPWH